jgi:mycofactocin system glycosyltransferase
MNVASARRFRLDGSYRRPNGGRVVIGGSPLRVLTVAERAISLFEELERSGTVTPSAAERTLLERLVDLGILHPVPDDDAIARARATATHLLTIVTPCFRERDDEGLEHPRWSCRSIVVDDGSPVPVVAPPDSTTMRLDANVGPGGARNAGLAEVTTPFVAFVDADVEVDERELTGLLAWFDDPRVALVAPRITAAGGASARARFEAARSPLDLGPQPARVQATTRVSYVPAAALVCRTDALRSIGGFHTALRWGEDVDLVWRLREAGWRCRYEPSVVARHRTRRSMRAWLAQRFRYGTSAAPLAERHRGALAPVRMSGWSAATWAPVLVGHPAVGLTVGIGTTIALVRKLRSIPATECLRLAGLGNLYAGRLLAGTLTRAWWPLALGAALVSRRARRVVAAAALVPILLDFRRERPTLDPVRYAALHLLDDVAYGAGVWAGAWRDRTVDPLLPSFESWPPREPG